MGLEIKGRIAANDYIKIIDTHMPQAKIVQVGDTFAILPRQLEIQVPNLTGEACNRQCPDCQGGRLQKDMVDIDQPIFSLIDKLQGQIPYFIFSGNYSEPTLNNNLIEMIERVKGSGANFGLHTNGVRLHFLENTKNFIRRIVSCSGPEDYISISLMKDSRIDDGLASLCNWRKDYPEALSFRLTYLVNETNNDEYELENAMIRANTFSADSLRFSIPYAPWQTPRAECLDYKRNVEIPSSVKLKTKIKKIISSYQNQRIEISIMPVSCQDVETMNFEHCVAGYYSLVIGANGEYYKCPTIASSDFAPLSLGKVTENLDDLYAALLKSQNPDFNPQHSCFPLGARCCRATLEINRSFNTLK